MKKSLALLLAMVMIVSCVTATTFATEDETIATVATEEATTEEATTEEVATEEVATEEVATEEVATEEVATEEATTEEVATEEATTEEVATEEVATEEVATEEATTEEVATEEVATEEVATEEVPEIEEPDFYVSTTSTSVAGTAYDDNSAFDNNGGYLNTNDGVYYQDRYGYLDFTSAGEVQVDSGYQWVAAFGATDFIADDYSAVSISTTDSSVATATSAFDGDYLNITFTSGENYDDYAIVTVSYTAGYEGRGNFYSTVNFTQKYYVNYSTYGTTDPGDREETYTVTFKDGVSGTVFSDVTYTVTEGDSTPSYTPTRTGYTFDGWTPTVASSVTENATYTATWTLILPDSLTGDYQWTLADLTYMAHIYLNGLTADEIGEDVFALADYNSNGTIDADDFNAYQVAYEADWANWG